MNKTNVKVNVNLRKRIVALKDSLNVLIQPIPFEFKKILFPVYFKEFISGHYYKQVPIGKCQYCGVDEATKLISSPNFDEIESWGVCINCDTVINLQQKLTLATLMGDDRKVEEIQHELELKHPDAVTFTIKKVGGK